MRFFFSCLMVMAFFPFAVLGQATAEVDASFGDATTVLAVEVPVHVVGKDGEPIRGLTVDNFEIEDGRRKQPITDFEVFDLSGLDGPKPSVAELSPVARRHFLLLFDLSFSDPSSILQARRAAQSLVDEALHPTDVVGVATFSIADGSKMVLNFSPDRRQVALAIQTLGAPNTFTPARDPLGLILGDIDNAFRSVVGSSNSDTGGPAGDEVADQIAAIAAEIAKSERSNQENQILAMSRSLADLAKLLDHIEGSKHLVYLSEGFDSSLFLGTNDFSEIEKMNQAAASGQTEKVDNDRRFGNTRLQKAMNDMLDAFKRSGCTIQAVDIGGLRAGGPVAQGRASGEQALFYMANETGGELYRNSNDLGKSMESMLERTSVTYLLTFQPQDLEPNGEYRRLKVKLKNGPRGARVVARPGYHAPKKFGQQNRAERQLGAAEQILGGEEGGSVEASVLAAAFKASPGRSYVPVLVEIDGPSLLQRTGTTGMLGLEVHGYALDAEGGVHGFFNESLGLDLSKLHQRIADRGVKFFGHLDLPPGEYTVRTLVRNLTTGGFALRVIPLTVPTFGALDPVLLPAFFADPNAAWVWARENPEKAPDVPFPFVLREGPFFPAVLPVVKSGDAVAVNLIAYNLEVGAFQLDVQVENAAGQAIEGGSLSIADRFRVDGEEADRLVGQFKVGELAPGDYNLIVTVADPETGISDSSRSPFRVIG